jgi:hypothetical protein
MYFSIDGKEKVARNLTSMSTSQEVVSGLYPGEQYNLSIIGIGCKNNQTTEPIQVTTNSFEHAIIQLESDGGIKLGN